MSESNGHTVPSNQAQRATLLTRHALRAFAQISRAAMAQRLGNMFDGVRRTHMILGYKDDLQYEDFKIRYIRQDISHRIVSAYPEATWSQPPELLESLEPHDKTAFETAWEALAKRLRIFAKLQQADKLAQLGQYSVLLIGLRHQPALDQPARPVRSPDDVLYLVPYSEEWAKIDRLEGNPGSEQFGKPSHYRINLGRASDARQAQLPVGTALVHASRVLHFADDQLDDEIYGIPRLEPIYDRLDDLLKVVGGGAEGFWQDAKRRLIFSMRDDGEVDPDDEQGLSDEIDEFIHELRSFVRVQGMDVTALNGAAQSPKEHFEVLIDLIAACTGLPKRILTGSERGQLASEKDEENWLQRISQRQQQKAEPEQLRPLVDWCITYKALPTPPTYVVKWANLFALSEPQQADVAQKVAAALNSYAPGAAATVVAPEVFVSTYLGLDASKALTTVRLEPDPDEL